MKQILLNNAYEAWRNAIQHHDEIERGISSLQHQKSFVSSLHNAVELFLKQIMLNNCDKDVAKLSKRQKNAYPNLEASYNNTSNLNDFFDRLNADEINAFHSIEFTGLIGKHVQLLGLSGTDYTSQLELLQKLRNAETHFYINGSCFLEESNFVALHNFMVQFYNDILRLGLFPHAMIDFENTRCILIEASAELSFSRNRITVFSYKAALGNNPLFQELKRLLQGDFENEYATCYGDNWEMAWRIADRNPQYSNKLYNIFAILQLMEQYALFQVIETVEKVELDDGQIYTNQVYSFLF